MEDKSQTNQVQTASMNRTKAPQKVEVVVANSSSGSEVNILGELSIFVLRIGFCALMIHHGLEKLQDPQGFAEFVVGKYFPFLPGDPVIWTFGAAITQLVCPLGLALGIFARLSSLGLDLELQNNFLPSGNITVGITSGASTPDKVVADVIEKLIAIAS